MTDSLKIESNYANKRHGGQEHVKTNHYQIRFYSVPQKYASHLMAYNIRCRFNVFQFFGIWYLTLDLTLYTPFG